MFKLIVLALISIASVACSERSAPNQYEIHFVAKTNDGDPLGNVAVAAEGKELGVTDQSGILAVSVKGHDGQQVTFNPSCPDGYREPAQQPKLILRTFQSVGSESKGPTTLEIVCTAVARYAVIAVKTQIAEIPLLFQGEEIAQTTSEGVAHAMLKLPVESNVRLELDTRSRPELRPQSPSRIFSIEKEDTLMLWNQEFNAEPVKRARAIRKKEAPPIAPAPYRLE
ncbi:MAG: hypothetical protein JXA30_08210 [Deltaproteobacteria bacterium]|nr:hypothetical protein [Deltaproteobacteria bacterium]